MTDVSDWLERAEQLLQKNVKADMRVKRSWLEVLFLEVKSQLWSVYNQEMIDKFFRRWGGEASANYFDAGGDRISPYAAHKMTEVRDNEMLGFIIFNGRRQFVYFYRLNYVDMKIVRADSLHFSTIRLSSIKELFNVMVDQCGVIPERCHELEETLNSIEKMELSHGMIGKDKSLGWFRSDTKF